MKYTEVIGDLFTAPPDFWLAHCISADFEMGKGIAVQFNDRFDMKRKLKTKYPNFLSDYRNYHFGGVALVEGRVINLVTKERYWQKPTYKTMREALNIAKLRIPAECKKIAMPLIGSGLDKLEWDKVSKIVQETFEYTEVEIVIYRLG